MMINFSQEIKALVQAGSRLLISRTIQTWTSPVSHQPVKGSFKCKWSCQILRWWRLLFSSENTAFLCVVSGSSRSPPQLRLSGRLSSCIHKHRSKHGRVEKWKDDEKERKRDSNKYNLFSVISMFLFVHISRMTAALHDKNKVFAWLQCYGRLWRIAHDCHIRVSVV